jgi:DNA-binding response OmpR family regulator
MSLPHPHAPTPGPDPGPRRVLIVDDDKKFCRLLSEYLEPFGYATAAAHTGTDGAERAISEAWHAVILDMMLPGLNGLQVLQKIREVSEVPVLMLTARGEEVDRIVGLEFGADDYLPKTFSTRELLARLRAVTRRQYRAPRIEPLAEADIVLGKLRIAPASRAVALGDEPLTLTPVEFDLLLSLARAAGRVRTRDQLLEEIRERDYEVFDRSIDVHISALRKKLGDDAKKPHYIRTFRSAGYMLMHPEAP